ncbi:hypothetical protein CONPUDRAFT_57709 [Coniophora puteana RWD-64-598 SS2]|uniref:Uncharacterized protein n=1 Tax=Coniophora puteana (strain RWD-64-598) TaxID=741705 RepID=A0A5M3MP33_CONPW|nr:uncharacterized protein CONPUDRAFT_57709 [Coniophora puteana RWD-64-598 SS2]EIW80786.1 hypothetical protein CONPUDRAFT_57709 [Coniophora puteana RWD-64-598 SS2]
MATSPGEGTGWSKASVTIDIPTGEKLTKATERQRNNDRQTARRYGEEDPDAPPPGTFRFTVPNFHHRSLCTIIREVFTQTPSKSFHYHPFKLFHQSSPERPPERVYQDAFTADAFLDADRKLQESLPEPGCSLPRAVAGIMLWSDATHVAQFGQAKLWPIYVYFANQCKYERGRPSSHAARCVAYLPSLPDSITDHIRNQGRSASAPLLAHCRRELFHASWGLILNDEFLHAYEHGIVVQCSDGQWRRLYPRIFTYSADYPEKVLIATVRDFGGCPCPFCTMPKDHIPRLGTKRDWVERAEGARIDDSERQSKVQQARDLIYRRGLALGNTQVEDYLKPQSWVPTTNAFSRLSSFGFNYFNMLVVDQMHEFELGVWKALLTHLVRIIHQLGSSVVDTFNERCVEYVLIHGSAVADN